MVFLYDLRLRQIGTHFKLHVETAAGWRKAFSGRFRGNDGTVSAEYAYLQSICEKSIDSAVFQGVKFIFRKLRAYRAERFRFFCAVV